MRWIIRWIMPRVWWHLQQCTKIILLLSKYNNILNTSLLSKYQHRIVILIVKDNRISTLLKDNGIKYVATQNISDR